MVMDHLTDRSSYGKLRLWGQMGFGIGSSGVGVLLSRYSHDEHASSQSWPSSTSFSAEFEQQTLRRLPVVVQTVVYFLDKCWHSLTGYRILFLTHALLSIPTWMCIQAFRRMDKEQQQQQQHNMVESEPKSSGQSQKAHNVESKATDEQVAKKSGSRVVEGLKLLVHDADALLFFFLVLVTGISSGVIENFAYVRMREVGGTGKAMGMSRLVSSVAGAPMFWFSGPLAEALGVDRVIVVSLLSYITRFIIYAFMRNPYHGLPAEALRGVTFAAFWSTATIYAHRVSPPGLHATMLMFLNAMYGGLGQSLGAIIGGKLQHRYGTVRTFLYSAAVDFVFVGFVILYLSVRKNSSFQDPKPIQSPAAKAAAAAAIQQKKPAENDGTSRS